jgi:tetratricopeptide (TPR) repeat protein
VLRFTALPSAWLEGAPAELAGPCDVSAVPLTEGFEIRLSYPDDGKGFELRTLVFSTGSSFVVDHWMDRASSPASGKKNAAAKTPPKKKISVKQALEALPQGETLVSAFDDEGSWEKLLGQGARPLDLNSPEFERFRASISVNAKEQAFAPPETLPLEVPSLEPGPADEELSFAEETLSVDEFRADPASGKEGAAAADGMNFVRSLVKQGKWLKAQQSAIILEKSKFGSKVPQTDARWWALKGLVHVRLADELKERAMLRAGLGIWREGLRRTAALGGVNREYAEYMALESVRLLLDNDLDYGAASLLTWLQRYAWTDRTEERFAFLRAEVLMRLGLYSDANALFTEFVAVRSAIPLSGRIDRRLVPAAAFRLGDIAYRERRFADAVSEYSKALTQLSGTNRFSFEGSWLPDDVRIFPHVLMNRAAAALREGGAASASRDLRAFLFVSPNHRDAGWAYFLLGDGLMRYSKDPEKAIATWREGVFKVPDSVGTRLASARITAYDLASQPRDRWPRLIASIEDARPTRLRQKDRLVSDDALETYVTMILADAFLKADDPTQALMRLDLLKGREPGARLEAWTQDYLVTAFTGTMLKKVREKKYKEVVTDYEQRRTTLFLRSLRPRVLYTLALAHEGLELWEQALETFDAAEALVKKMGFLAPRPYSPSEKETKQMRARITLELFLIGKAEEKKTRQAIEAVEGPEAHRIWTRFHQKRGDLVGEARAWDSVSRTDALSWSELRRYSAVLKKLGRVDERRRVVEARVGAWFTERRKPVAGKAPEADLVMELLEVREAAKDLAGALVVADHLLTLPDAELGADVTKPMVAYRKGQILRRLGRFDDARESFLKARTLSPDSLWSKLSAAAEREMQAGRSL